MRGMNEETRFAYEVVRAHGGLDCSPTATDELIEVFEDAVRQGPLRAELCDMIDAQTDWQEVALALIMGCVIPGERRYETVTLDFFSGDCRYGQGIAPPAYDTPADMVEALQDEFTQALAYEPDIITELKDLAKGRINWAVVAQLVDDRNALGVK